MIISITDYLISTNSFNQEYCTSLLQKSLKKNATAVFESIEGYQMIQEIQDKQKEKAVKQAISFLIAQSIIKASDISFQDSTA